MLFKGFEGERRRKKERWWNPTVSFSLHAWFGVCSFFGHYLGNT